MFFLRKNIYIYSSVIINGETFTDITKFCGSLTNYSHEFTMKTSLKQEYLYFQMKINSIFIKNICSVI